MVTAGVDIGTLTTKVVLLRDGDILASSVLLTGESSSEAVTKAMDNALRLGGLAMGDVASIVSTGIGKDEIPYPAEQASEVICDAKGAHFLHPTVGTVVDIGAESSRVVKCGSDGRATDFALNDKCAAGTGVFLDAMARALEVKQEDMGRLSLESTEDIDITSMCVVFAESEVVSQIHRRVKKVDILAGIHKSIATRVSGMTNKIGVNKDVMAIGGVARNIGVVKALEKALGVEVLVPENPQIAGALGAALVARERK